MVAVVPAIVEATIAVKVRERICLVEMSSNNYYCYN